MYGNAQHQILEIEKINGRMKIAGICIHFIVKKRI